MALSDAQKGLYLQEMGIQSYFPRRALPGAKPSRAYAASSLAAPVTPQNVGAAALNTAKEALQLLQPSVPTPPDKPQFSVTNGTAPAVSNKVSEQAQALAASLTSLTKNGPVVETKISEPPEPPKSADTSAPTPIRFAFAFIPINEHLAVITELPWAKSVSFSPTSQTLLAGILKALGVQVEAQHLNPMVFTWPLFEEAGLDLDGDSARQTLEGFVGKRLRLRPVQHLLLMAEDAAQFLFPEGFLDESAKILKHPRLDVRVVMTHSLSAMEPGRDPAFTETINERKRQTWHTLQPLKAKFNGSERGAHEGS